MAAARRCRRGRRPSRLRAAAAARLEKRLQQQQRVGDAAAAAASASVPSSFVVRRGRLTAAARQLVRDCRKVMAPYCSERLRERRSTKLRDYLAAASVMKVSHMQLFSQTESGFYYKLVQLPAGPTLTFRVSQFCLMRDVQRQQSKRQQQPQLLPHQRRRQDARDFEHPPLLVLSSSNNSDSSSSTVISSSGGSSLSPPEVEALVGKMVKGVFPALDVRAVQLRDCRRVVLFRRDRGSPPTASASPTPTTARGRRPSFCSSSKAEGFCYQLRQYAIVRRTTSDKVLTPGVRALVEAASGAAAERALLRSFGVDLYSDRPFSASTAPAAAAFNSEDHTCKSSSERLNGAAAAAYSESSLGDVHQVTKKARKRSSGSGAGLLTQQSSKTAGALVQKMETPLYSMLQQRSGVVSQCHRDVCEATLAGEYAAASVVDTDDDDACVSLNLEDAQAAAAAGLRSRRSCAAKRSKEGLLLSSVAAAAAAAAAQDGGKNKLRGTADSAAEVAPEADGAEVTGAGDGEEEGIGELGGQDVDGSTKPKKQLKIKVSLVELGPRMQLDLVKVEANVCSGAVLFHNLVKKSSEELQALRLRESVFQEKRQKEREELHQILEKQLRKRRRATTTAATDSSDSEHEEEVKEDKRRELDEFHPGESAAAAAENTVMEGGAATESGAVNSSVATSIAQQLERQEGLVAVTKMGIKTDRDKKQIGQKGRKRKAVQGRDEVELEGKSSGKKVFQDADETSSENCHEEIVIRSEPVGEEVGSRKISNTDGKRDQRRGGEKPGSTCGLENTRDSYGLAAKHESGVKGEIYTGYIEELSRKRGKKRDAGREVWKEKLTGKARGQEETNVQLYATQHRGFHKIEENLNGRKNPKKMSVMESSPKKAEEWGRRGISATRLDARDPVLLKYQIAKAKAQAQQQRF